MHIQYKIRKFDYTKFNQYTHCTVLFVYVKIYSVHKAHTLESHAVIIAREYIPYIQNTQQESHKQNICISQNVLHSHFESHVVSNISRLCSIHINCTAGIS